MESVSPVDAAPVPVAAMPEPALVVASTPSPVPLAAPAPIVMAPVIQSESPLRFVWVPLAVGVSTILAMLPRKRS